jgi:hypothetical protein
MSEIKIVKRLLKSKKTELQRLLPLKRTSDVKSRINYIRGRIKTAHAWIIRKESAHE